MTNLNPVRWGECTRDLIEAAARRNALVVDTDIYQVERATVEGGEQAWTMITDRLADRFRLFVDMKRNHESP